MIPTITTWLFNRQLRDGEISFPKVVEFCARELDAINTERQSVETRILFEAEGQLSATPEWREDPVYVLAGEEWHPGVVGIVASRLVERYHRLRVA